VISTPNLVIELLERLERIGIQFIVGGSFASSAWGQPRQTYNLDLAVLLKHPDIQNLHELTRQDYAGSESQMCEALESTEKFRSFQLLHFEETFKIDFFVLNPSDYVYESLRRAKRYELAPGKSFPFASPEDMVITKLRWFVLGNRVSDKQWNDIVQVLEIQQGQLDEAFLDKWAAYFGVFELLVEARSQVVPPG
jgi:hypothetical protein